jgi:hypothetical protein
VAAIHIASNSSNHNPYDINLRGNRTIWTGPPITFTHDDYSSTRDQLTPNVWLTRDDYGGIQNVAPSPGAIEWAVGTTANLALTFQSYQISNGVKPPIGPNLVLHLISEDIYLDIRITSWTDGGGGGFSYTRSTPAPVVTNRPPVANAGTDFSVNEGQVGIVLDGTLSSDPDNDPLTYAWTQEPGGTAVTLTGANTVSPTFTAPVVAPGGETLSFKLTVTAAGVSATDTVSVTVVNVNHPPVARAGDDQSIAEASPVTLHGENSFDIDNDPFTYTWVQLDNGNPMVALTGANTANPTFTAPTVNNGGAPGVVATLLFELRVSDGFPSSPTDQPAPGFGLENVAARVTVFVTNVNNDPIARAGLDQTVNENTAVTLNGSDSSDPDSDALTYSWAQVGGPAVALTGATTATPGFTAPFVSTGGADFEFALTVDDGYGGTATDNVVIHVQNINDPPNVDNAYASICRICDGRKHDHDKHCEKNCDGKGHKHKHCEHQTTDDIAQAALWPPDHAMVRVCILGVSDPNNNTVIRITGVTQDEPTSGLGDGDTRIDAIISADGTSVLLRAERSGKGDGRVYHVHFTASDPEASVPGVVKVYVPRNKKSQNAVDGGELFDSTVSTAASHGHDD